MNNHFVLKSISAFLVLCILACTTPFADRANADRRGEVSSKKHFDHFIVIVLENTDYDTAIADPYLKELMTIGTAFTNFNGIAHPSYSNYLAMVAGDDFNTIMDIQMNLPDPTIADLLEKKGLNWKSYAEDYPGKCYLGSRSGNYARKHVPLLSFKPIQKNSKRCARVVPGTDFELDRIAGNLPEYSFFTPNMNNDGHDTNIRYATRWLKKFLEPLLSDPMYATNALIEITFDESERYDNNHLLTIFLGDMVQAGAKNSDLYDHYDVLKMVEDNFDLGNLGKKDSTAVVMDGFWK